MSEAIKISGTLEVITIHGKNYLIKDAALHQIVNGWSSSQELDPTSTGFVPSNVIYTAIQEVRQDTVDALYLKVDKTAFNNLINNQLKQVAFTANYNDLVNVPNFGGARVENTTLIFTGSSSGQEEELLAVLALAVKLAEQGQSLGGIVVRTEPQQSAALLFPGNA